MSNLFATLLTDQIKNFEKESKKFTLKFLLSKYSNQYKILVSKKLSILLLEAEICLKHSYFENKSNSADNLKTEFDLIKRLLKMIIRLISRLEKHSYLTNPELKQRIFSYLSCIYDIEMELKQKVYRGKGHPTNPEIIKILVSYSMDAIASRLKRI